MKKVLLVLIAIISSLSLCSCTVISNDGAFETHREDFEIINDMLLSIDTEDDRSNYSVVIEDGKVIGIYDFSIELDEEQLYSLNQILSAFKTDFSFIDITKNRVSYGGNGSEMYVYSKDGKKPQFFYYEGDKVDFSVESLGDNWYFCYAMVR